MRTSRLCARVYLVCKEHRNRGERQEMFEQKKLRQLLEPSTPMARVSSCLSVDWEDRYCVFVNRLAAAPHGQTSRPNSSAPGSGPLASVGFVVKDSIDVLGFATTNGTAALNNNYPTSDHQLVARLRSMGGICVGKANLDEMSYGWASDNAYFGQVINPTFPEHSPGGSSGGCAAAVAGGAACFAVGEDTVGSVRIPAAFCGLSAYRALCAQPASHEVCPLTSSGYDQLGLIAPSIDDISKLDSLIHDYEELPVLAPGELSIAVAANFSLSALAPEVEACMHDAIFKLAGAGATLVMHEVPDSFGSAACALTTIVNYEFLPAFNSYLESRAGEPATLERLLDHRHTLAARRIRSLALPTGRPVQAVYERARLTANQIEQDVVDYFQQTQCQVLIHPTVAINVATSDFHSHASTDPLALARHVSVATCARTIAMNFSMTGPKGLPVGIEMLCAPTIDSKQALAICRTIETIVKD